MPEHTLNFEDNSGELAIGKFEEMLKKRASYFFDVEEFENITEYYVDRGNIKRARKAVDYAIKIYPDSTAILLKRAQVLSVQGQFHPALNILENLELIEPNNFEIFLAKANIHRQLGNHRMAARFFKRAIELSDGCEDEIYFDLALEQENYQDYQGAIDSLKIALVINPDNEAAIFELAHCYDHLEDQKDGIIFLEKFIDDNPYSHIAWYHYATCLARADRNKEALEAFEYSTLIAEEFSAAYFGKGNVLVQLEKYPEAIIAYKQALEHHYDQAICMCYIGECYERLEDFDQALIHYRTALDLDDSMTEALVGIGIVKEMQGKLKEAISYFSRALDLEPGNTDYLHIFAEALAKNNQKEEAIEVYEKILNDYTEDEEAWLKYGKLLAEEISTAIASEVILNALQHIPESSLLRYAQVNFLLQDRKLAEADNYFALALEHNYEGHKEFLKEFPDALRFPNIVRLIEQHKK